MRFSTHYYVLSLSDTRNALFEAFRDSLIGVENQGFPVLGPARWPGAPNRDERCDLARAVDRCFRQYHAQEPLRLVVVGAAGMQSAFRTVTAHDAAVIGRIDGDHTATSTRDLGQIVWPVVKDAMSGLVSRAMRDLDECSGRGRVASGLEAVAVAAGRHPRGTLLVEDDYHLRGSIRSAGGPPVMIPDVDVRDAIDDAVDAVIEAVLESAGSVVFVPSGALRQWERIALLRHGTTED